MLIVPGVRDGETTIVPTGPTAESSRIERGAFIASIVRRSTRESRADRERGRIRGEGGRRLGGFSPSGRRAYSSEGACGQGKTARKAGLRRPRGQRGRYDGGTSGGTTGELRARDGLVRPLGRGRCEPNRCGRAGSLAAASTCRGSRAWPQPGGRPRPPTAASSRRAAATVAARRRAAVHKPHYRPLAESGAEAEARRRTAGFSAEGNGG